MSARNSSWAKEFCHLGFPLVSTVGAGKIALSCAKHSASNVALSDRVCLLSKGTQPVGKVFIVLKGLEFLPILAILFKDLLWCNGISVGDYIVDKQLIQIFLGSRPVPIHRHGGLFVAVYCVSLQGEFFAVRQRIPNCLPNGKELLIVCRRC